jgi:hypothetical protein
MDQYYGPRLPSGGQDDCARSVNACSCPRGAMRLLYSAMTRHLRSVVGLLCSDDHRQCALLQFVRPQAGSGMRVSCFTRSMVAAFSVDPVMSHPQEMLQHPRVSWA